MHLHAGKLEEGLGLGWDSGSGPCELSVLLCDLARLARVLDGVGIMDLEKVSSSAAESRGENRDAVA